MLLIFSVCFGIMAYVSYRNGRWNPLTVFLLVWTTICFLYSLHLFGIYDVDIKTECAIIIGVLFFFFGYSVSGKLMFIRKNNRKMSYIESNGKNTYLVIKIIVLLDYIYMVPIYVSKIIMILQSGWSIGNAKRLLGMDTDMFTLYVFDPFNFFLVALSAYLIIYDKKEKFLIVSGIILNILSFTATGSRARIMFFVLAFLSMTITEHREMLVKIKRKTKSISFLLIGIILVVSGLGLQLFRSAYFYACTCVPLLDDLITRVDSHFTSGKTYGLLSLNGFLRVVPNYIENYVNPNKNFSTFDLAENYIGYFEYAKYIAPGEIANSFYSFIGNFYLDFGFIGIVWCSFMYGFIICYLFKKSAYKNDPKSKILIAFVYYAMCFSMVRCPWMNIRFSIGFLFVILLGMMENISNKFTFNRKARKR